LPEHLDGHGAHVGIVIDDEDGAASAAELGCVFDRDGLVRNLCGARQPDQAPPRATRGCGAIKSAAPRRALLQPVYDRFTKGFDTAAVKAARALLEALP
jgi:hypothetical protein